MEEQRSGSGLTRWIFIAIAAWLFITYGWPLISGKKSAANDLIHWTSVSDLAPPPPRPKEQLCSIETDRFTAELTSKGASLAHYVIANKKYANAGKPLDLVTITTREDLMPLRTDLRPSTIVDPKVAPSAGLVKKDDPTQQVSYDDLDYELTAHDKTSCTFTYSDANTKVTKTIAATGSPYELSLTLTVENLADTPKKHRLSIQQGAWHTEKEIASHLGRQSEWFTEVVGATASKTDREKTNDFEPSDYKKKEFNDEQWRVTPGGDARYAAVSSVYFAQVVAPEDVAAKAGGATAKPPQAETRIEEIWDPKLYPDKSKDPNRGFAFRARLAYPPVELAPKQSITYKALSFNGPKEREVLAAAGHDISGVLNLGTFSVIGKGLIWYLYKLEAITRSWGWAIVLLTVTVRLLVFPLSLAQIKHTVAMRKLKPEMDAINAKYKDDMTQRGLATQELFRKHGMSQFSFATGCLPMILQLPVWWALYTALQTAVELYHVPFLWMPDLSAADQLIRIGGQAFGPLPFVLGATSFLQQKMMPAQGTDPSQQKMMMYLMPGVFTVMMLFLPSGLGVYMLTSSVVSIGQQLVVERYLKRRAEGGGGGGIIVKVTGDGEKPTPALGKGKARVRG